MVKATFYSDRIRMIYLMISCVWWLLEAEVWREVEFLVVITNYHKAVKQSKFYPKSEGHLSAARRQLAN